MKRNENAPAVYCGTYAKYNAGSIKGAWVDLTQFDNGKDFVAYCRKLHGDEADPELMFQDYENFPDWMYSESMNAQQVDEILTWWKAEQSKPDEPTDALTAEYIGKVLCIVNAPAYWKKQTAKVIRLQDGGLLPIGKESIETRFCFHDEGPDYEFYKSLRADDNKLKGYFFSQNLSKIDRYIEQLSGEDGRFHEWKIYPEYGKKAVEVVNFGDFTDDWNWSRETWESAKPMEPADKIRILDALFEVRAQQVKRLEAWWKRYGAEKIYMWTYWADA